MIALSLGSDFYRGRLLRSRWKGTLVHAASFQACILTACVCSMAWCFYSKDYDKCNAVLPFFLVVYIYALPPKKQSAMQRDFENSQTSINFLSTRSNFLEMVFT